jgi:hypothetical protein
MALFKFSGVMALFYILVFVGRTLDVAKILEIMVQRMVLFPILAKNGFCTEFPNNSNTL